MKNNQVSKVNMNELIKKVATCQSSDDPDMILKEAAEFNAKMGSRNSFSPYTTNDYKALSLYEFDNGILLTEAVPDKYRTLAIQMMRRLQEEFNCITSYEKSLSELAALSYVRVLDSQTQLSDVYTRENIQAQRHDSCDRDKKFYASSNMPTACKRTDYLLKLANHLSKELDRAYRQYLGVIQVLSNLHKPVFQVNIKTNTAVVANQQVVNTGNV